eukprot:g6270.t1
MDTHNRDPQDVDEEKDDVDDEEEDDDEDALGDAQEGDRQESQPADVLAVPQKRAQGEQGYLENSDTMLAGAPAIIGIKFVRPVHSTHI